MQTSSSGSWQNTEDAILLAKMAADAALSSNWSEAIAINQKILKTNQEDVEALNRLARAQVCTGEIDKAQKTYKKVLELDPYNIIANKNLNKINASNGSGSGKSITFSPNLSSLFLSEPGKTKVVGLLNLAPPTVLAVLNYGEEVRLIVKTHAVAVTTTESVYIGALPDDTATS